MSKRPEYVDAILAALPLDRTGHVADCGIDEIDDCGCHSLPTRVEAIVARHVAAALEAVSALADGWERDVDVLRGDAVRNGDIEADWLASQRQQHLDQLRDALTDSPARPRP